MRGMNMLLSIAITTGILSGIWGWVAVSLGLLSWAGFLGCTAYFACPQRWVKGLWISACTLLSGVVWALVIINGSALAPHMDIIGYVMTGIVAFLMCIRAKAMAAFICTGHVHWRMCNICRAGRLATGCSVTGTGPRIRLCDENSGLWLASRRENRISSTLTSK